MNYLFVKDYEYSEYKLKSNRDNRIRIFWKEIFGKMPTIIKQECKEKITEFIQQSKGEFEITGAIPFQFETKNAGEALKEYLNKYAVFVEHDTDEVHRWKESIESVRAKMR